MGELEKPGTEEGISGLEVAPPAHLRHTLRHALREERRELPDHGAPGVRQELPETSKASGLSGSGGKPRKPTRARRISWSPGDARRSWDATAPSEVSSRT